MFGYALLYVFSGFAITFTSRSGLVTLLWLSSCCLVTVGVLWLFLMVPWVGLQCMIVVFPDHTHFLSLTQTSCELGALFLLITVSKCDLFPCDSILHTLVTHPPEASFVRLFVLLLYVPINSYGYGGTVSSPNHTFSWASLNKRLISTSCTYFRLYLTTTLLELFCRRYENDRINNFKINLWTGRGLNSRSLDLQSDTHL